MFINVLIQGIYFGGGGGFLLFVGFYVQLNELNKID